MAFDKAATYHRGNAHLVGENEVARSRPWTTDVGNERVESVDRFTYLVSRRE